MIPAPPAGYPPYRGPQSKDVRVAPPVTFITAGDKAIYTPVTGDFDLSGFPAHTIPVASNVTGMPREYSDQSEAALSETKKFPPATIELMGQKVTLELTRESSVKNSRQYDQTISMPTVGEDLANSASIKGFADSDIVTPISAWTERVINTSGRMNCDTVSADSYNLTIRSGEGNVSVPMQFVNDSQAEKFLKPAQRKVAEAIMVKGASDIEEFKTSIMDAYEALNSSELVMGNIKS